MQQRLLKISNNHAELAFRCLIIAACLGVVWYQLFCANKLHQTFGVMQHNWLGILFMMMLLPLNWLLEAMKWKQFFTKQEATITQLLKSILVGLCVGTVTPWRSGEFPGRIMYLPAEIRIKALHTSLLGGLAQAIITLCAGISFVFIFNLPSSVVYSAILCVSIALLIYFSFGRIGAALANRSSLRWLRKLFPEGDFVSLRIKLRVLLLAMLRYSVYSLQWVIALKVCGINLNFPVLFAASATILLIHSVAPAFPLFDFAIRTSIAVFVCGFVCSEPVIASVAATLIWFINIAIPTLAGAALLTQTETSPQLTAEQS